MSQGPGGQARLPDREVLTIIGEELSAMTSSTWELLDDALLKGPGSLGVRFGVPHSESPRHFDLEFLLNVERPDETALINCATGLADDPEVAARQAISSWCQTTAAAGLEVLSQDGRYASHFGATDEGGIPGWHMIAGGITGWGFGEDRFDKQQWMADTQPWAELAPLLAAGLDRSSLNGIRLFIGQGGDYVTTEVRINGKPLNDAASALAELAWPRTEEMSVAHTFLLLVHPSDEDGDK